MRVSSFVNNPDETPLHDSGLAPITPEQAASMKLASFSRRQHIDANRKLIGAYRDSLLRQHLKDRKHTQRHKPHEQDQTQPAMQNRQGQNSTSRTEQAPPRRAFTEPPRRGYNPYG